MKNLSDFFHLVLFLTYLWLYLSVSFLVVFILYKEYVLNDTGAIWYGTIHKSHSFGWNFGQFEDGILDVALSLLVRDRRVKKTKKGYRHLADPVWLARIMSAQESFFKNVCCSKQFK